MTGRSEIGVRTGRRATVGAASFHEPHSFLELRYMLTFIVYESAFTQESWETSVPGHCAGTLVGRVYYWPTSGGQTTWAMARSWSEANDAEFISSLAWAPRSC